MNAGDRVLRLYRRSDRGMTQALRVLRGTFDGVWLGILSRDQLARLDELYYDREPRYHDEAYNRSGLFDWERTAVDRHFTGVRDIIVTSAGAGRETLALAKAGFKVHGFEPHRRLVDLGRRLIQEDGVDATLAGCVRDLFPSEAPDADAVVVGWGGYMLISGRADRVNLLTESTRRLPAGAPVLVSFFAVDCLDARLRTTAAVAGTLRGLRRREPTTAGDALVPTYVHYFSRKEIATEMDDAGLELVDFGDDTYGWAVGRVRPATGRRGSR